MADGTSRGAHLRQAGKMLGDPSMGRNTVEPPEELKYLVGWFEEITKGRTGNGFGPNPISAMEIAAWCSFQGFILEPWEFEAMRRLDALWLSVIHARSR